MRIVCDINYGICYYICMVVTDYISPVAYICEQWLYLWRHICLHLRQVWLHFPILYTSPGGSHALRGNTYCNQHELRPKETSYHNDYYYFEIHRRNISLGDTHTDKRGGCSCFFFLQQMQFHMHCHIFITDNVESNLMLLLWVKKSIAWHG